MALYSMHGTKVYKSASCKADVPLAQFYSHKKVEFFDTSNLAQLFQSKASLKRSVSFPDKYGFKCIELDRQTFIDVLVKIDTFQTDTDGVFTMVTLAEVDLQAKQTTGRYIVVKLSKESEEKSKNKISSPLEIIEEA